VDIHNLRFKDRSGFQLDEFTADSKISPTQLRLKKLIIRTPQTDLHTDLTFDYTHFGDFDDFLTNVHWTSGFRNCTVSFNDIACFAPDLTGFSRSVKLDGDFKGTVSKFRGKKVTIEFGNHSFFKGNVSL